MMVRTQGHAAATACTTILILGAIIAGCSGGSATTRQRPSPAPATSSGPAEAGVVTAQGDTERALQSLRERQSPDNARAPAAPGPRRSRVVDQPRRSPR